MRENKINLYTITNIKKKKLFHKNWFDNYLFFRLHKKKIVITNKENKETSIYSAIINHSIYKV